MPGDHWNAHRYEANARFVTDLAGPLVSLFAPRVGEDVLDLGCGDGALTRMLADQGINIRGVDASPDMVASAAARGVRAEVMDAQALPFNEAFDAVLSNAALHWMPDADAVLAGVYRALRPGGRFVAEQGGMGNIAAIRTALIAVLARRGIAADLRDIWYFPSVAEQTRRLEQAGFRVEHCELVPRPTVVHAGMNAWLETLAAPVLGDVPTAERAAVRAEVAALLAPALCDADGNWTADYVRLRFKAVKP